MIEVVLDKTAAPAEVQAVKQAFEDAALLAEVSADLEHASATLPPWVISVTVATASLFLAVSFPRRVQMHGMGCVTSWGNSIEPTTKPGLPRGQL